MNKKVIMIILLITVICLFLITTTIAFITRSTTANNIITFGSIKMQIIQTTLDSNNEEKDVDNNEILNIIHNPTISRIVKVKNLGKHDFFVRISLDMIAFNPNNEEYKVNDCLSYNFNTEDWIYEDGWYYYKKIVKQGEITNNLITQINFDVNKITKEHTRGNFKFNIKAEAVQAKNNAQNVLEVVGWPSN